MGNPQPPTPIQTDNTTALGVVNNTIAPRRMKSMDMRFHWLRNCIQKLQFRHYWMPGPYNKGDCVTKYNATIHHMATRMTYLTQKIVLDALQRIHARTRLNRSTARVC